MVLWLSSEHLQHIVAHAEHTYPDECCGIMLGLDQRGDRPCKILVELWTVSNAWDMDAANAMADVDAQFSTDNSTKSRRYWIDPRDMLSAQRCARDRQMTIIGIYHSHPDHSAIPSECDRVCAWSQYSYVIASVQRGQISNILSWTLDDQHQFEAETMLTTEASTRV
ncbi:MAG TPA: Mov34/MPN/PAD-1 family protein [Elainellaceae cyanobacterium]